MKNKPLILALMSVVVLLAGPAAPSASAQLAVPPPMPAYQPLSGQQLDQLLGPIALYPDPLLAILLPAATLPTQVVMADRYVISGSDPNAVDQQPWDSSVQALARYPSVLSYMDNNLDWTTELGQAFLNQQQDVMDSIQRLRISAGNFGNLVSTPQEQVVNDNGDIEILPVDPNVIYVPAYQPAYVYYQSGFVWTFGAAFTIGAWLNGDFDWHNRHLFFWDRDHPRPANWWHERPDQRATWMARRGAVWRPEDHRDQDHARQGDRGWVAPDAHRQQAPSDHHDNVDRRSPPPVQPRPMPEPRPTPVRESGPVHVARPTPPARPAFNGAFGGNENSRDARDFSNRGQQSLQTVRPQPVHTTPAPSAPRPAPSFHGGGSQPRH